MLIWVRKAALQIHLWVGVLLAVYAVIVGVTGSVLVFRDDIQKLVWVEAGRPYRSAFPLTAAGAVAAQAALGVPMTYVVPPTWDSPQYIFGIRNHPDVYVDATTGKRMASGMKPTWFERVESLHYELALGEIGWSVSGAASVGLLLLVATGLLLWWPGVARLSRSLTVDLGRGWRRVIWQLHGLAGLYGALMLVMWSLTALCFIWPEVIRHPLKLVSPISQPLVPQVAARSVPAETMLLQVEALMQRLPGRLRLVRLPVREGQPMTVVVCREPEDRPRHMDQFFVDPSTGVLVGQWWPEDGKSFSDLVLRWAYPLHAGIYWGLSVKALWALLGLLLPLLSISGLVMYWNRYLGKQWKKLRS